ncbi:MAG TPA: sugar kinase [Caulobacteraceae bacterium]|jgi:2-dehydro-3-deoxygluconokinase
MIRAVCIGEAMIELRSAGADLFARAIAGDAYNTAVYMRRALGADNDVAFLTAVGDDSLSGALREDFVAHGLSDRLAFTTKGRSPGLYLIELDAQGDRSFHYWRQASAARLWMKSLRARGGGALLAGADLIYFSGISLAILEPEERAEALAMLGALRGQVGRIAFDPNVRPKLWPDLETARVAVEAACALSDIVLPSSVDGEMIWNEHDPQRQLDRYRALGPAEIALTQGEAGVLLACDGDSHRIAALKAKVVDTSGAGDSFNGAYLAARLQGLDPQTAVSAGQMLAAVVVTKPGALVKGAASVAG